LVTSVDYKLESYTIIIVVGRKDDPAKLKFRLFIFSRKLGRIGQG